MEVEDKRLNLTGTPAEILEMMVEKISTDVIPIAWKMLIGIMPQAPIQAAYDQYIYHPPFGLHVRFRSNPNISPKTVKYALRKAKLSDKNLIKTHARVDFVDDLTQLLQAVGFKAADKLDRMLTGEKWESVDFEVGHYLVADYFLSSIIIRIVPGEKEIKPKDPSRN